MIFFIRSCNSCRFPIGLSNIRAELFRMSKGSILGCNVLPQAPAATGAYLCITNRCMILITINSTFCTASVCYKYQIIFSNVISPFPPSFIYSIALAVFFSPSMSKRTLVTLVPNWICTPAASRYFCIGRIRDSY